MKHGMKRRRGLERERNEGARHKFEYSMRPTVISSMKRALLNSLMLTSWLVLMQMPAAEPKPAAPEVATLPKQTETARDASGRLVRVSSVTGNQVVTRDAAGRVLVRSTIQGQSATHRDASGRLLATTAAAAGKETTRDASGRLQMTATANAKGDVITYRDASGRLKGTKTTSRSGRVTFRDAGGRLTGPDFR